MGLWEASSGTHLWWKDLGGEVAAVAFSPDGRYIAADGSDSNGPYVALLSVSNGTESQRTGANASSSDADQVNSVAFSPDGNYVAIGVDLRWAWIWDLSSDSRRGWGNAGVSEVYAVAFSPDGRYLAAGDDDGIITFWQTDSWLREKQIRTGSAVTDLAWSPGGSVISDGKKVYQPLLSR